MILMEYNRSFWINTNSENDSENVHPSSLQRLGVLWQRKRVPAHHGEYQLIAWRGSVLHLNPVCERAKVVP